MKGAIEDLLSSTNRPFTFIYLRNRQNKRGKPRLSFDAPVAIDPGDFVFTFLSQSPQRKGISTITIPMVLLIC